MAKFIIAAFIIAAVIGGGYFFADPSSEDAAGDFTGPSSASSSPSPQPAPAPSPSPSPSPKQAKQVPSTAAKPPARDQSGHDEPFAQDPRKSEQIGPRTGTRPETRSGASADEGPAEPNAIGYELGDDSSHGDFASKFQSYQPISQALSQAQSQGLRQLVKGAYAGDISAKNGDSYRLELDIDGVIESDAFIGTSTVALDHNGRRVARQESQGDLSDFKVNDQGELVFTDIGGVDENSPLPYYIFKINVQDASRPYFSLSRFTGSTIKNLGTGILSKR